MFLFFFWLLASDLGLFGGRIFRVVRWQIAGFQQVLKDVELSHKPLRLYLARLERQGM
jgi:hypothetical protein